MRVYWRNAYVVKLKIKMKVLDWIPKTRYMSLTQLELGFYKTVANFDIGKKNSVLIYEKPNLIPEKFTLQDCHQINCKRLFASKYKKGLYRKKRRKIVRGKAKQKDDKINPKKYKMDKRTKL